MDTAMMIDRAEAGVKTPGASGDKSGLKGVYKFKYIDPLDPSRNWEEDIENLITTLGKNAILDNALAGSAYTATGPFMGLISSVGYTSFAGTISSGTYTAGAVSLVTSGAHGLTPGDTFTIASAAGTGSFAALNGTFLATTGTTGTTLNFTIAAGLTMTITGGNVTGLGVKVADTMASHGGWFEVDGSHAPTVAARLTTNGGWSAAASGAKALASTVNFTLTQDGTVKGAFLVFGSGAVATIASTAGTLLSAGLFAADRVVYNGGQLQVSYSLTMS